MSETKTDWLSLRDPNFLNAYCIPGMSDFVLTVKGRKKEEMFNQKKQTKEIRETISFQEEGIWDWVKPYVPNVTALKTIRNIVMEGLPFEDCIGKKVKFGVEKVKAFGEVTEAIRVRPVKSTQLQADYDTFTKSIGECKSKAEITDLIDKYKVFKPFYPEVQKQIKELWNKVV